MGFVQITSRLGAMLSPWVVDGLGTVRVWAPFALMGVLSVLVGVFLHFLPETKDKKTAEFLENDVKQEQGKFGLPSSSSRRKKRPDTQKLSLVREEDEENIEA